MDVLGTITQKKSDSGLVHIVLDAGGSVCRSLNGLDLLTPPREIEAPVQMKDHHVKPQQEMF
jgi:hypothetical protein